MKPRILSGMRSTGKLHLGNFHGALENWIKLQNEYDCFFFVADWHSLTTDYANTANLKLFAEEMLIDWLACGIDPKKATLFIQSWILEHAELHLLLSMMTPISWLERVPSYKDIKAELSDRDLSTYGFLGYPMLQTADIVIYDAKKVPVGEDQIAHIELSREVVRRFNFLYKGEILIEPQPLLTKTPKVPGLDRRKMSKSYNNCIYISDTKEEVHKKIMPAVTDPSRKRRTDPGNPDVCIIHDYHRIYSPPEVVEWSVQGCRTAAIGCVDCKKKLLEYMDIFWEPVRERRRELAKSPKKVWEIAKEGTEDAKKTAKATMERVREAMKLRY
ncbi:MAG: tryptophan--tRNA ligase [Deltaproteobacteria bacterium]|nr:tryptophan--tRNA ligase [Deltaproteobacteria bacterium]MBI2975127.1 tryptophan--tRNA ligase [Deltaproteobacteria bacterium]